MNGGSSRRRRSGRGPPPARRRRRRAISAARRRRRKRASVDAGRAMGSCYPAARRRALAAPPSRRRPPANDDRRPREVRGWCGEERGGRPARTVTEVDAVQGKEIRVSGSSVWAMLLGVGVVLIILGLVVVANIWESLSFLGILIGLVLLFCRRRRHRRRGASWRGLDARARHRDRRRPGAAVLARPHAQGAGGHRRTDAHRLGRRAVGARDRLDARRAAAGCSSAAC